jgi:hypothetical protein
MIIPDKYKIPDNYRRKVLSGYFSIILIFISLDLIPTLYGTLNSNWVNTLTIITLIPGVILGVYFFIGFIRMLIDINKNPNSIKNKSTLRTHYLLIWILIFIWLVLNHFIYKSNLSSLLAPIIIILLIVKFMK